MTVKPGGFSEAGISTTDPQGWGDFLSAIGGYEEIWRGQSPGSLNKLWGIEPTVRVTERLMGAPGLDTGFIRLFHVEGVEQDEIRRGAGCRDSGGIFDLDIRVPAVLPFVESLKHRGWVDFSGPVDWPFGELQVREWLASGPDSVIFALIQRLAPPLEGFDQPEAFSHVFNSSQIVTDMDEAVRFYEKLGFCKILHHSGPLAGQGGEVLGLTAAQAPKTHVELVILQPAGVMNGSVELVQLGGGGGRDVSALALPYNLGLNLLRFPVNGLRSFAEQLTVSGLRQPGQPVLTTRIEPFGETEIISIQTPDGAWLEFFEAF